MGPLRNLVVTLRKETAQREAQKDHFDQGKARAIFEMVRERLVEALPE